MSIFLAALLGLIAGSFLNALSFRMGTGRSVMRGRSKCMRCGHVLGVLDLVPVFSWLFLRGRCRWCRARISWQYPLVELSAAALGAGVAALNPEPLGFVFWFVAWMTLLFTFVYDLRHLVIPWSCTVVLGVLGLAWALVNLPASASFLIAGPILSAPLFFISLVSQGRWMGWGDGLLELGIGWLLGLSAGFSAFLLAFWSGAIVGIGLLLLRRGYTMKSELPFAPFLILGAGVAYFFYADLFYILPLFWR